MAKMVLMFDINADIIETPQYIIDNRELMRKRFLKWIYNRSNKHSYWVVSVDSSGREFLGLRFRGKAFVEWLNRKVLHQSEHKAAVIEEYVAEPSPELPTIFF